MTGKKKALIAIPGVLFWIVVMAMGTPFCARCGDHDEAMVALIEKCPRAIELLGADPHPALVGMACGSTSVKNSSGEASWSAPYTGDRARGTVEYNAIKSAGEWGITSASLEVDGETIDVLACAGGRQAGSVLAQTNADAAHAQFSGKVTRSSHASIAVSHECTGKMSRERASAFADLQVTCRANASEGEGTPLYAGRGKFTLDVGDSSRREDDRIEYADDQSATGCRLSAANGAGTLTVFSLQPAWEVVIEL